ncbi:hypothetical protein TELCIR_03685 [Teladorsagia circumcincta]|uniref:Uncharacterized protein n=1 Tax=Teladorsagia circumcincta TaxID=45464 RepID=A0A2G9UVQ6_TELCI|nr:hypothetical protein TELCIR_03685 [Teladorsagia circumcincta]
MLADTTQLDEVGRHTRLPRTLPARQGASDDFSVPAQVTDAPLKGKLHRRTRSPRPTLPPVIGPLTDPTQSANIRAVVVSVEPQVHTFNAPDASVETVSVGA